MSYTHFARFYDVLTRNVRYKKRAAYFKELLEAHGCPGHLLLDLACGTGSLSLELAELGYEVIGADASPEMLSVAMQKAARRQLDVLFLCQAMESLDLYGTVDACICALDSVNHLPDEAALARAIARVALFLSPGGLFVFDVNTAYKHREILGCNTFVYDLQDVCCIWQNSYQSWDDSVEIALDFFVPESDGRYSRFRERFRERIFSQEVLQTALEVNGLDILGVYGDDSFEKPGPKAQRLVYICKKRGLTDTNG